MQKNFLKLALPAVLAIVAGAPAFAQIRLGLDLGPVRIRISPEAPPPPRTEIRLSRPSRSHVWIGGYWDRQDDRWAWAPGRWEAPGQRGSRWIKPRYQREGGAYRYEPGHWSNQRMEEGDDYSRWRNERGRGNGKQKGNDRGRDRDDRGEHDRKR
jgi:hypothetical protein